MNKLTVALATAITLAVAAPGSADAARPAQAQSKAPAAAGSYVPRTERARLAGQIIRKWSGYVGQLYGTAPMDWARAMEASFTQADIGNLRKAARKGTYEAMSATLLGQELSDDQVIDKLARSDGSKEAAMVLGSSANDLVYTMVTPCRIADTRVAVGPLQGGVERGFIGNGANFLAQGGANSNCGIPSEPSALALNITVVNPAGTSFYYLTAYPATGGRPLASSLNFKGGSVTGNEVIVRQTIGQPTDFRLFSNTGTDVVVDVAGYFMAPNATALDCTNTSGNPINLTNLARNGNTSAPACPAGYTSVGVHVGANGDFQNLLTRIQGPSYAYMYYGGGTSAQALVYNRCCRVPGR